MKESKTYLNNVERLVQYHKDRDYKLEKNYNIMFLLDNHGIYGMVMTKRGMLQYMLLSALSQPNTWLLLLVCVWMILLLKTGVAMFFLLSLFSSFCVILMTSIDSFFKNELSPMLKTMYVNPDDNILTRTLEKHSIFLLAKIEKHLAMAILDQ